jgi:ribonuclease P protein component
VKRGFRLTKSADIKRVRRSGKSSAHPFLALVAQANEGNGVRVGVLAGKTVGGAVQRNRAKRVMRAAIAPLLDKIKDDHDLLLIAKPGISDAKSQDVQVVLETLLAKSKAFK